ncbi:MAG: hypothetical protein A6F71_00100 [Cycloclasticus sp. symbiont of Poecilosclerida sp. M]|nr:MAG: hypothetical protein A6F71_00100 [Cycloclasticus sp. symbiont of Poecilosclerida sp. M]
MLTVHYAQCPACQSTLQLQGSQVQTKDGLVRCGHCNEVFNVLSHAIEEPQEAAVQAKPYLRLVDSTPATEEPKTEQKHSPEQEDDPSVTVWEKDLTAEKTTSYYDLLSIVLLLALVFQFIYFKPEILYQNTSLQPFLQHIDTSFNTDIPRYKSLTYIRVVSRQLFPHSSVKNALRLDIVIKNTAAASQEFPTIAILLTSNLDEETAYGTFIKEQYLPKTNHHSFLAAGETKFITISFHTPRKQVTGFEIKFID